MSDLRPLENIKIYEQKHVWKFSLRNSLLRRSLEGYFKITVILTQCKNTEGIRVEFISRSTTYILDDLGKKPHSPCASAPNT